MSTRATLTFYDDTGSYSVYRHCDGYPLTEHGVLATLAEAYAYAWGAGRWEAADFAAACVVAWKKRGGNIYLTQGKDAHGDTEWHYQITGNVKGLASVTVYKRVWSDNGLADTWAKVGKSRTIRRPAATN